MAAEWILQGWSYDPAELAAFVGSNDEKRAKKIARAAKELHDDDRLDETLEEILLEIVRKKLVRDHDMSYRIALEAVIGELGDKLSFDVNPQSKGYKRLTTYGLKERLDEVLRALGQKTLVRAWNKPVMTFPTPALGRATQWPIATSLDPRMLTSAAAQAKTLPKRSEIDARARKTLKGDEDFAESTADVVVVLAQLVTKAAKRKKRSLMVLVDGEQ